LFALSTELLPAGAEHAGATGYALQPTGRYAHSAAYLRKTAALCGWAVDALAESVIRMNAAAPIHGNLCVLRRLLSSKVTAASE
jgi:predicted TPR repeat methyltransferase